MNGLAKARLSFVEQGKGGELNRLVKQGIGMATESGGKVGYCIAAARRGVESLGIGKAEFWMATHGGAAAEFSNVLQGHSWVVRSYGKAKSCEGKAKPSKDGTI